jgi:cation transport ATPase
VLDRPIEQRVREHKYRFAQTLVFGLPVIGLQYFGHRLGGPESARWVVIMQAILTGWILYIGATGMLSEGAMLFAKRRAITGDFLVANLAVAIFLISLVPRCPRMFHIVVIVLAIWSGARWLTSGRSTTLRSGSAARSEA